MHTDEDKIEIIKEIIIQQYIHKATSYNNHDDCSYTGQIITVGKSKENIVIRDTPQITDICVIIMELASMDLSQFLIANGALNADATRACILLARKLDNLWKAYKFNHCDFHAKNILLYYTDSAGGAGGAGAGGAVNNLSSYNLKLADFGFAQLKITNPLNRSESLPLIVKNYGYISKPERDIVLLLADFICHRNCEAELEGQDDVNNKKARLGVRINYQSYINTNDFPRCIPDTILDKYNSVQLIKDNPCGPKTPVGANGEPFITTAAAAAAAAAVAEAAAAAAAAAAEGAGRLGGGAGAAGGASGSGWEEFAKRAGLTELVGERGNVEAKPLYSPGGGRRKTKVNRKQKYKKRKTKKQRGGRGRVMLEGLATAAMPTTRQTTRPTTKIANRIKPGIVMKYNNFGSSMENYYDWLRFECFPKQIKLKQLFNVILNSDLRKIGTDTLEGKTIDELIAIAEKNRNSKPLKDIQLIVDAYFAEPDRELSYYLLRLLLFTQFTEGSLNKWLVLYMRSSPENKHEMLPKILYTSYFI